MSHLRQEEERTWSSRSAAGSCSCRCSCARCGGEPEGRSSGCPCSCCGRCGVHAQILGADGETRPRCSFIPSPCCSHSHRRRCCTCIDPDCSCVLSFARRCIVPRCVSSGSFAERMQGLCEARIQGGPMQRLRKERCDAWSCSCRCRWCVPYTRRLRSEDLLRPEFCGSEQACGLAGCSSCILRLRELQES